MPDRYMCGSSQKYGKRPQESYAFERTILTLLYVHRTEHVHINEELPHEIL